MTSMDFSLFSLDFLDLEKDYFSLFSVWHFSTSFFSMSAAWAGGLGTATHQQGMTALAAFFSLHILCPYRLSPRAV